MAERIVFIRAINVGGTARLPMAELREIAVELGATDVSTYIASGNLLCTPPADPAGSGGAAFDRALEDAIEARFGFRRDVISRSVDEVDSARAAHPFEVIVPKLSFVTFLTAAPTRAATEKAEQYPTGDDRWAVIGRDLHIRYAVSPASPQMKADAIGRALGVPGTARNLLTVQKVIELARG